MNIIFFKVWGYGVRQLCNLFKQPTTGNRLTPIVGQFGCFHLGTNKPTLSQNNWMKINTGRGRGEEENN